MLNHLWYYTDACRFRSSLSHCTWRKPEQGLLGSGPVARVHSGVAETSVPMLQGIGFQLLNRSSEPYRPPHLCKAKNYSGRESLSKDHYNDETFGTPDHLSQDRAEEEKMRRDSFELMRKEQEMATQEKQKIICDEHTENLNPDIAIVLEDSGVYKTVANKNIKSQGSEPCDVKGHSENPLLCSSDLTHQLLEGEKTAVDQKVIEYDPTKFSFGTNGFGHNLKKSAPNPVTKEISMESYGRCNPVSYECLEEPILSKKNGYYSNQRHSINGRSSYDVDESQSNCFSYDAASQHSLSLLQKGAGLTDLAESSKLNMWSLDKPHVSETEIDHNQLNKSGRSCINNFEKNLHGPDSGTLVRDSQSTALSGTRRDLTSRPKWDDTVESQFPFQIGDYCIIPLKVNESGSIGDVEGIEFSSFVKQTGLSKRSSDLLISNIQAKVGFDLQGGPESKHSSLSSFDELDICLPEEDSLITVDDYIFPQDSMFVAAGGTSSALVNTFGRLSDCGVAVHLTPSQHLRVAATGFDHSDEMACYAQVQNTLINSSLNFDQQYNYLEKKCQFQVTTLLVETLISKLNRNFDTGIESKADASSYYS
ncbi:hypothetical protein REPUB_Repub08aG0128200 [Reevesia pubescens]